MSCLVEAVAWWREQQPKIPAFVAQREYSIVIISRPLLQGPQRSSPCSLAPIGLVLALLLI